MPKNPDEVLAAEDLWQEYVEKFGEEPQFLGRDLSPPTERLIEVLETGIPIKDPPVPSGIVVKDV